MDKALFQSMLDNYKDRIFSYATYLTRSRDDAEDVTQEVFIKLWKNIKSIDEQRTLPWLMRVTHNHCISLGRKKTSSPVYKKELDERMLETVPSKADSRTNPELNYESGETSRLLIDALGTLPPRTRSMIILHYYHGLKYQEIGEILDVNVNTVKVEVHRSRKLLRKTLEENFPERSK